VARTLSPDAKALAAADPVMAGFVERFGELSVDQRRRGRPKDDPYGALLRSVVAQQVSAKAAASIHGRVLEIFGGRDPTPAEVLEAGPEKLRAAGLSGRKVSYICDLARHVEDGELELDRLNELSDSDVVDEITAIRGFGMWSAHMFLIFFLERPDVLPTGDLGIRRATQLAYDLPELPDPAELERIAEPWRPHRTLACLYLWESLHNAPPVRD
jgi:DNA-3-methyladenine glycosylase II